MTEYLTPREEDVIRLIARGFTSPAIAAELGISVNTVRTHVHLILIKTGAATRSQAVAVWRDWRNGEG